jgi:hypothetical protein
VCGSPYRGDDVVVMDEVAREWYSLGYQYGFVVGGFMIGIILLGGLLLIWIISKENKREYEKIDKWKQVGRMEALAQEMRKK